MIREAILEAAAAIDDGEARLTALRECVQAIMLRSFHESGAFGSIALTGRGAARFGCGSGEPAPDLDFVLVAVKDYAPERWLFKAQRYLRFSGLEARIAFARKGNQHSGWVKVKGLAEAELGFRIQIDANPRGPVATAVKIVAAGGEDFGIRYEN